MKPVQIQEVMELARLEFRRWSFRADGGRITQVEKSIRCEFETEAATGQAAFTQYKVTPHFRIWVEAESTDPQAVLKTDEERIALELSVSYDHIDGGSNGYSARYELVRRFLDEPQLRRTSNH